MYNIFQNTQSMFSTDEKASISSINQNKSVTQSYKMTLIQFDENAAICSSITSGIPRSPNLVFINIIEKWKSFYI